MYLNSYNQDSRRVKMINPLQFDCPPPNYEETNNRGWESIAKAIVTNQSSLTKMIKHAKRIRRKQKEWQLLPFRTLRLFPPQKKSMLAGSDRKKVISYSGAFCSLRGRKKQKIDSKMPHLSKKGFSFSKDRARTKLIENSSSSTGFNVKKHTFRSQDRASLMINVAKFREEDDAQMEDIESIDSGRATPDCDKGDYFEQNHKNSEGSISKKEENSKITNQVKRRRRDKFMSQRSFWKKMKQKTIRKLRLDILNEESSQGKSSKGSLVPADKNKSLEMLKRISGGSFDGGNHRRISLKRHSAVCKNPQILISKKVELKRNKRETQVKTSRKDLRKKINLERSRTNVNTKRNFVLKNRKSFCNARQGYNAEIGNMSRTKFIKEKSVILEESISSIKSKSKHRLKSPGDPKRQFLLSPLHRQMKPSFQITYQKFQQNKITKLSSKSPHTALPANKMACSAEAGRNLLSRMQAKRQVHNSILKKIYDRL
ncbi:unnamed protein product [Moneuplotes crassus]|uniref:Uncharacterized protein n=1 Tax=Euplotes crassus TaxID=5936 RepID=A0AAD1X641_EUPCR|nr:unnamed protein product [Moneuplotes crassus]